MINSVSGSTGAEHVLRPGSSDAQCGLAHINTSIQIGVGYPYRDAIAFPINNLSVATHWFTCVVILSVALSDEDDESGVGGEAFYEVEPLPVTRVIRNIFFSDDTKQIILVKNNTQGFIYRALHTTFTHQVLSERDPSPR